MARLCPGKSKFIKSARDLHPAVFRRLVARRVRRHTGEGVLLTGREADRRKNEVVLEKISEEPDFLPAHYLTRGAARSAAVCRIVVHKSRGQSFGTGFLVAPGILMTNNHVLETEAVAQDATAEFNFEQGAVPVVAVLRPERMFITDAALDFTLVAVEGRDLEDIDPIRLRRDPTLISRHEPANIIQHPNARRKEVAIRENPVTRVRDKVLHYRTDTEPGSSGSPVFNDDWELVALHHAGVRNDDGTATNEGIRISAILDHLIRRFRREESAGSQDAVREFLATVTDSSPLLGFFDTYGLDRGELEIQVDDFQGLPEFADIGVWNIEHFNRHVSADRVNRIAGVVERLALDVFGLTEVEKASLDRLVEEMAARGSHYDYVLRDTRGSQDIAVLFDADTTTVTRRSDIADRHRSLLRKRTSAGKTAFPRWPLFAQCKVDNVEFIMIVVHLKAFGDTQSRARRKLASECLVKIIDEIRETEGLPVVLGGDFNNELDTGVLDAITESPDLLSMTSDDATDGAISYVGARHRSLIDHIMVSSDARLGEIEGDDVAVVRLDRSVADFADQVSDHVPLVFRMVLRDQPHDVDPGDPGDGDDHEAVIPIPEGAQGVALDFV